MFFAFALLETCMRSCGALHRRNTDNYATVKGLQAGRSEQPGIRIVGNIL